MVWVFTMWIAGLVLLFLTSWFAMTEISRVTCTGREVTDFAGDVESWLRHAGE